HTRWPRDWSSDVCSSDLLFLRNERSKLGVMRSNEYRVIVVFVLMVVLFTFPAFAGVIAGNAHPVTVWANRALNVWVIPPAVMFRSEERRVGKEWRVRRGR